MVPGFCQFGEEAIIAPVFAGMGRRGMVVDVGAADGVFLSHSRGLILAGWSGILIDPLPRHADALCHLYHDNRRVKIWQAAVSIADGEAAMHVAADDPYNSTLVPSWREVAERNGERYAETITVRTMRLDTILGGVAHVDFLTVDAEMMDLEVLQSFDWKRLHPALVCAEGQPAGPLNDFMESVKYRYLAHTRGNVFWQPSSK